MTEVAFAMEYLHVRNEFPIVHCDLNPKNILLDEDMVAHVGDFGIAKILSGEERMLHSEALGTVGYIAPEYGSEGLISTKVDVYSYGILLMEMLSRRKPTDEMFTGELTMRRWISESYPDSIMQIVDTEQLNTDDSEVIAAHEPCFKAAVRLALECTSDFPEERPNMSDILIMIKKIKLELNTVRNHFGQKEMVVTLCLHNSFHDLMERHLPHSWRDTYDRFLQSQEERDVGIGYGVGAQYFLDIENMNADFEEHHINAYLAILHKYPEFARVRKPTARVAIADTMFSVNVEEMWKLHHGDDAPETTYDSESMEDLCSDELQFLVQYVRGGGERSVWGDSSGWLECDTVCLAQR